ncbi:hypothetical protein NEAUS06_1222 [Nematocida ausubeli]|nr:hypothetical protein NEAUS06_1222 [Nematocida ausubeli]
MDIFGKITSLLYILSAFIISGSHNANTVYRCYERVNHQVVEGGLYGGTDLCIFNNTLDNMDQVFINIYKSNPPIAQDANLDVNTYTYRVKNGANLRKHLMKGLDGYECATPPENLRKMHMPNSQMAAIYCQVQSEGVTDIFSPILPRHPLKDSKLARTATPEVSLIINNMSPEHISSTLLKIASSNLEMSRFYALLEDLSDSYCINSLANENTKSKRIRCHAIIGGVVRDILRNQMIDRLVWVHTKYYHLLSVISNNPNIKNTKKILSAASTQIFMEYELIYKMLSEFDDLNALFIEAAKEKEHTYDLIDLSLKAPAALNSTVQISAVPLSEEAQDNLNQHAESTTANNGTNSENSPGSTVSAVEPSNEEGKSHRKLVNLKIPSTKAVNGTGENESGYITISQLFKNNSTDEIQNAYMAVQTDSISYIENTLESISLIISALKQELGIKATKIKIPVSEEKQDNYVISNEFIAIRNTLFQKQVEYQNMYIAYNNLAQKLCELKNICPPGS